MVRRSTLLRESVLEKLESFRAAGSTLELETDIEKMIAVIKSWKRCRLS